MDDRYFSLSFFSSPIFFLFISIYYLFSMNWLCLSPSVSFVHLKCSIQWMFMEYNSIDSSLSLSLSRSFSLLFWTTRYFLPLFSVFSFFSQSIETSIFSWLPWNIYQWPSQKLLYKYMCVWCGGGVRCGTNIFVLEFSFSARFIILFSKLINEFGQLLISSFYLILRLIRVIDVNVRSIYSFDVSSSFIFINIFFFVKYFDVWLSVFVIFFHTLFPSILYYNF